MQVCYNNTSVTTLSLYVTASFLTALVDQPVFAIETQLTFCVVGTNDAINVMFAS